MIINQIAQGGGGSQTKYGATVETFLGDVDSNGVLQNATTPTNLTFSGVQKLSAVTATMGVLFRRFQNLQSIRKVSFPDLNYGCPYGMSSAFYSSSITELSMPNLLTSSYMQCFANMCFGCTGLTSVDLRNLTYVTNQSFSYAFSGCTALTSVNLSSLSDIRSFIETFKGCTALESIDLSTLEKLIDSNSMTRSFEGCTSLKNVDMSGLQRITGASATTDVFKDCTALETFTFTSLDDISAAGSPLGGFFRNCTALKNVYFPALKSTSFGNQGVYTFNNMVAGVTGCTIHFPSNLDPQGGSTMISSLDQYPNFGGTNTVLAFDL